MLNTLQVKLSTLSIEPKLSAVILQSTKLIKIGYLLSKNQNSLHSKYESILI